MRRKGNSKRSISPASTPLANEQGSQTLEFAALFPLVVVTILIMWQFALAAYAVVVGNAAARDAARVAAVEGDWATAARRAATGFVIEVDDPDYSSVSFGRAVTVRVRIRIPTLPLPFLRERRIFAETAATMPAE